MYRNKLKIKTSSVNAWRSLCWWLDLSDCLIASSISQGRPQKKPADHNCWDDGEAWREDLGRQSEDVVWRWHWRQTGRGRRGTGVLGCAESWTPWGRAWMRPTPVHWVQCSMISWSDTHVLSVFTSVKLITWQGSAVPCRLLHTGHWCCWQAASQVGHTATDGGVMTSAIHCWLPSIPLETLWQLRYINSHLPYHTIPLELLLRTLKHKNFSDIQSGIIPGISSVTNTFALLSWFWKVATIIKVTYKILLLWHSVYDTYQPAFLVSGTFSDFLCFVVSFLIVLLVRQIVFGFVCGRLSWQLVGFRVLALRGWIYAVKVTVVIVVGDVLVCGW